MGRTLCGKYDEDIDNCPLQEGPGERKVWDSINPLCRQSFGKECRKDHLKQAEPVSQCWGSPLLITQLPGHRQPAGTHVASVCDGTFPVVPALSHQRPLRFRKTRGSCSPFSQQSSIV